MARVREGRAPMTSRYLERRCQVLGYVLVYALLLPGRHLGRAPVDPEAGRAGRGAPGRRAAPAPGPGRLVVRDGHLQDVRLRDDAYRAPLPVDDVRPVQLPLREEVEDLPQRVPRTDEIEVLADLEPDVAAVERPAAAGPALEHALGDRTAAPVLLEVQAGAVRARR